MIITQKHFYEQYEATRGRPYNANFGKDGSIFKRLEKTYGAEYVKRMIDYYLCWDDPFVKLAGYTVGIFQIKVNTLLDRVQKPSERIVAPKKSTVTIYPDERNRGGFKSSGEIIKEIFKEGIHGNDSEKSKT